MAEQQASHAPADMPPHPLTLDGAAVLHQMYRMQWARWNALEPERQRELVEHFAEVLGLLEGFSGGGSAAFAQIGHKGDLMLVHFRESLEDLNDTEILLNSLELFDFMEQSSSYVSFVELGLYDSTVKLYEELLAEKIAPTDAAWAERTRARMDEQAEAMAPRLRPSIPPNKYLCFYPMDKKRGEDRNWYMVDIRERRRMMREHGMIGRRYAGRVKQIISGSIGFDDWEWGVDLFADDPLVFKQLIYEMRFDEASAVYALFGPFYIGIRVPASEFTNWLIRE